MKQYLRKLFVVLLCMINLVAVGCGNQPVHSCNYTVALAESQYLKSEATCMNPAEYYYSCSCGNKGEAAFTYGELGNHDYSLEIAKEQFLKCESTVDSPAIYYKTCVCGAMGEATFEHGEKYPALSKQQQALYKPTSLTVTLYDTQSSVYGFTFNTTNEPLMPVIQIKEVGAEEWREYPLSSVQANSYDANDAAITYYISKTEISLEAGKTYAYRAYDKRAGIGTAEATLKARDTDTDSFTFVHVSDSQAGASYFKHVLSAVVDNTDFLLHTGDVVEWSKYEYEWTEMLDGNYQYLSQIPIMAISGNHETTYRNGSNETFKHFNNNIPTQASTDRGYFYSFVYGDVKFIMLNTNDLEADKLKDEQFDWLINELETNTCKWTVVAMHNPMYSVGKYGADSTKNTIARRLQKQLQDIFAEYGVDVVLQGHDHAISRTFPINGKGEPQTENFETVDGVKYSINPDGVIYLMNGPAGIQARSPYAVDDTLYSYAQESKPASWAEFTFEGDTLTVTVKWLDGRNEQVYYTWGIKKTA